ncbi:MAG: hypothetical protein JWP72_632 [Massilia sp.]|nr:hypothetical protein [Massilia sp.]
MRPTDENQAGSTRPNLMSSRRAVGEDNILAMLERDSARRTGPRASNLRLACYGAAAAFAGILVGGVAWLAYDNHKSAERLQAGHDVLVAVPPVVAGADAPPLPVPPMLTAPPAAPLPAPAANAPRAAVIVDEPAPAVRTASSGLPPLVMLPRHEAAPSQARHAATPAPRPGKEMAKGSGKAAAKESAKESTKESAPSAGTAPARPRTVQAAARSGGDRKADKKADKKVDKTQRTAARAATPASQRGAAKTAANAARQRKPASAPPQVDSDVALISAIISQSERHRGEREAPPACNGAKCPPQQAQP